MNLVIRSVGGAVVQDKAGMAENEVRGAGCLGGKAILISRKNTYAPTLVERNTS